MPDGLPDLLKIPQADGPDAATYVGPASWGAIYRSSLLPAYYRVLLQDDAPLASMQGARDWSQGPSRPDTAPITDVRTWFADDTSYAYIRYEAPRGRTLSDVLQYSTAPVERIQHVAKAVARLHQWRIFGGSDVSPMPAEIVFDEKGNPLLLAAPFRPALSIKGLLACPARALFVSPERLRGIGGAADDAESLYGFAVMAALSLGRPPELPAGEAILHGACRALLTPETLQSTLPRWLERVEAIKQMRSTFFRLLAAPAAERRSTDPDDLAARLEDWSERSTPQEAVSLLQHGGKLEEATALLREVLAYEPSYELLLLGAVLAEIERSPFEGVEYCERALKIDHEGTDARELQLQLITRNPLMPPARDQDATEWPARLKSMLRRNFDELPVKLQQQHEHGVAGFLIARSEFRDALEFVYPRMFDKDKVHLWWKFDLSLDYAEALIGCDALDAAKQQLHGIHLGIERATMQRGIDEEILLAARRRHWTLDGKLHARIQERQGPAGGVS